MGVPETCTFLTQKSGIICYTVVIYYIRPDWVTDWLSHMSRKWIQGLSPDRFNRLCELCQSTSLAGSLSSWIENWKHPLLHYAHFVCTTSSATLARNLYARRCCLLCMLVRRVQAPSAFAFWSGGVLLRPAHKKPSERSVLRRTTYVAQRRPREMKKEYVPHCTPQQPPCIAPGLESSVKIKWPSPD